MVTYRIVAVMYVVVGVSHWRHAARWVELFELVLAHRHGAWIIALYTAPVGLLILITHNVWVWEWRLIATLTGLAMTLKSALYFLFPDIVKRIARTKVITVAGFHRAGLIMTLVGLGLCFDAFL